MKRSARRRLPVLAVLVCTPLFVSYSPEVGAERAATSAEQDAAVCQAPADPTQAAQARLAEAVERARDGDAARDVIVLNGQGYNYAAGPTPDYERIQRELARERGEGEPTP